MPHTAPFIYRTFYDVPRFLVVDYQNQRFLFDSAFDNDLDEYPNFYQVFLLGEVTQETLSGSWINLAERAERSLGEVPIKDVVFDATLCREIQTDILDDLLAAPRPAEPEPVELVGASV